MKPDAAIIRQHLQEHYGLTLAQVIDVLRTPLHPAGMRDEFAAQMMPAAFMGAMSELAANPDRSDRLTMFKWAERTYQMADAALLARVSTNPQKEDEL